MHDKVKKNKFNIILKCTNGFKKNIFSDNIFRIIIYNQGTS